VELTLSQHQDKPRRSGGTVELAVLPLGSKKILAETLGARLIEIDGELGIANFPASQRNAGKLRHGE